MQLRCYLFKHHGGEVMRWFLPPDGSGWARQVARLDLNDGDYRDTSHSKESVVAESALERLLGLGTAELL